MGMTVRQSYTKVKEKHLLQNMTSNIPFWQLFIAIYVLHTTVKHEFNVIKVVFY